MFYKKSKNKIIIHLKVTPNSSKNAILGVINDENGKKLLRVKVAAVADDGKANKELIKFLARELGVGRYNIEIVSGKTSRMKLVEIACSDGLEKKLSAFTHHEE